MLIGPPYEDRVEASEVAGPSAGQGPEDSCPHDPGLAASRGEDAQGPPTAILWDANPPPYVWECGDPPLRPDIPLPERGGQPRNQTAREDVERQTPPFVAQQVCNSKCRPFNTWPAEAGRGHKQQPRPQRSQPWAGASGLGWFLQGRLPCSGQPRIDCSHARTHSHRLARKAETWRLQAGQDVAADLDLRNSGRDLGGRCEVRLREARDGRECAALPPDSPCLWEGS